MAHPFGHLIRSCLGRRDRRVWKGRLRGGGAALWGFAVWLCSFLPATLAGAQPAPNPGQYARFTVFSVRPLTDVAFVPRANAAPQKLQFFPTARSPRYEYRGPMPLRFIDPVTRAVVAEVTIPPGLPEVLLLFSPVETAAAGAGKLRYQVSVLDDSAARHGPGGLAIINFSGLELSGMVNDHAVTLKPGLNPTLPVGRAAKIRLTTLVNQRAFQSYAGTATLGAGERALLVLFPPFYPGSIEVQSRLLLDRPGTAGAKK